MSKDRKKIYYLYKRLYSLAKGHEYEQKDQPHIREESYLIATYQCAEIIELNLTELMGLRKTKKEIQQTINYVQGN